jgi:acyl-CoA thioesterase
MEKANSIMKLMQRDQFAKCNGVVLKEVGKGSALAEMVITDKHLNGAGIVQGGALFTLADLCFAAASNSYGNLAVTLDANINFVKGVSGGTLTAKASEIHRGRTIALYRVDITNENNELIAAFQSTSYIKRETVSEKLSDK